VLFVAAELFYREGIRAVGVDRLAKEAQVTATTLYRLFESKDGLVVAYLVRADQKWFDWLDQTADARGLAGVVAAIDEQTTDPDHRGCPFRMALAEYPSPDSEIHRTAIATKLRTRTRLGELAAAAGCEHPEAIAEQLAIIMEGIWACAPERAPGSLPGPGPALAEELLRAAIEM
jgi:AcrR family transcriptional regulator